MNIEDEELMSLFKRLGVAGIILLMFSILVVIFFIRKFNPGDSKILKEVKSGKEIYILIDNNSCNKCNKIKNILKENDIYYYEINVDRSSDYKELYSFLDINKNEIDIPTILYIKNKKFSASIVDIENEDNLVEFLNNSEK